MMAPDIVPPVIPDAVAIAAFAEVVFGYCEGWVPVRALAEKGASDRPPHTPFLEADQDLASKLAVQADWASEAGMAFYVVPGTVMAPGEAKAEDVVQTQVVLVDLDHGDIAAKRDHLLGHLGIPTLEVASGGVTPEGQRKLHLYWQLTEPAVGEDIAKVCRLRHAIAAKVGGDPAFRSAHQPIRVAGSVHAKGGIRRPVEILQRVAAEFDLRDLAEAVMAMPPLEGEAIPEFDFNDASAGKGTVTELFARQIREGGVDGTTRFDALSRVIGYWIRRCREGHVEAAQAWQEIVAYNEARIDPPWPLDRLQHEAERLWQRDAERGGGGPGGPSDVPGDGGPQDEAPPPEFTEDALALEFTRRYGEDWRFVASWGQWLVWTGAHWRHETTLMGMHLSRLVCREAAARCTRARVAAKIASASTVAAVERLARADRRHAATSEEWDRDPWALNTLGGVVDLRTGSRRDHDRADRMTRMAGAAPEGDCPIWKGFLATVTNNDADLQAYLKRMVGYSLTGLTVEHALFFLYGTGANGKSVFCNVVAAIQGDYATTAPMDMFMATTGERHPTDLAGLRGARFVSAVETEQGRRWAESKLKLMTGSDPIKARFMRQDFFEFMPQFKLVIAGNHKPAIRNIDEAMRRRFHMVPFTVTIPKAKRDKTLTDRLLAERNGILAWAIEGCLEWQHVGLKPPAAVQAATDEYFDDEDAMGRWMADACISGPARTELVSALYGNWKLWAEAAGEYVGSIRRFSENLAARGFEKWREPGSTGRGFRGIALKPATRSITDMEF